MKRGQAGSRGVCLKKGGGGAGTPLRTKGGVLKREHFITEIQCKRDIHFHLILVGILSISILSVKNRGIKRRFLAIRQILLRKMRVIC